MASLRYLNTVLTVLAVLLGLQLWTTWQGETAGGVTDIASTAHAAGIPNAGAQRQQIVDLLKKQAQQLDKLAALFETGRARVRLEGGRSDGTEE